MEFILVLKLQYEVSANAPPSAITVASCLYTTPTVSYTSGGTTTYFNQQCNDQSPYFLQCVGDQFATTVSTQTHCA